MDILAKKFWEKFTEIREFRPNMAFGDSPIIYVNADGADSLSNCEILCQKCHKNTQSYGR